MAAYNSSSVDKSWIPLSKYGARRTSAFIKDAIFPAPSTTADLFIETEPSGANIYLDSVFQGTSSLTISDLTAGTYSYTASLNSNYYTYYSTVDVVAGTNILSINLIPNPFVTSSADHVARPPLL
jgi:hypothetical protein